MAFTFDSGMSGNAIAIHLDPVDGNGLPRRITLQPGETFAIGRASRTHNTGHPVRTSPSTKNAFFDCPVISRTHAELEASVTRQSYVTITDLNSMHGTFVNDTRLLANESFELKDGDIIKLGDNVSRGAGMFKVINDACRISGQQSTNNEPDIYSSMKLVFKYGSVSSTDGGRSSYGVPDESDVSDDGYNSYRESDTGSIRGYELEDPFEEEHSPPTSVAAGDSPTRPIKLDADEPIFLDEPDLAEIAEEIIADSLAPAQLRTEIRAILPSIDLEAPEMLTSRGQPLTLPVNDYSGNIAPPVTLPMMHGALPQPVAAVTETPAESTTSRMAIPNMLAPTAITAPAQPQATLVVAPVEPKPQPSAVTNKTGGQKRKRADEEPNRIEEYAARLAQLDSDPRNPRCQLRATRRFDSVTVDPLEGFDFDSFLANVEPAPPTKRKRVNKQPKQSVVREAAKFTVSAALGAVGTFALLASPLGERLADWVSTL